MWDFNFHLYNQIFRDQKFTTKNGYFFAYIFKNYCFIVTSEQSLIGLVQIIEYIGNFLRSFKWHYSFLFFM